MSSWILGNRKRKEVTPTINREERILDVDPVQIRRRISAIQIRIFVKKNSIVKPRLSLEWRFRMRLHLSFTFFMRQIKKSMYNNNNIYMGIE